MIQSEFCDTIKVPIDADISINKRNDSGKVFNVNHWKDCRKPERQSNALGYEEIK